jgi:hypothetical protein
MAIISAGPFCDSKLDRPVLDRTSGTFDFDTGHAAFVPPPMT